MTEGHTEKTHGLVEGCVSNCKASCHTKWTKWESDWPSEGNNNLLHSRGRPCPSRTRRGGLCGDVIDSHAVTVDGQAFTM